MEKFLAKYKSPRPYTCREGDPLQSLEFASFWRLPYLSRAPRANATELWDTYSLVMGNREKMASRLEAMKDDEAKGKQHELDAKLTNNFQVSRQKHFAQMQNGMASILATAMFLNGLLRATEDPFDLNMDLMKDTRLLIDDTLNLAQDMLHLRPLYSCGFAPTLLVAWALELDVDRLALLEKCLKDYEMPSSGQQWLAGAIWFREYCARLRFEVMSEALEPEATVPKDEAEIFAEVEEKFPISRCVIL